MRKREVAETNVIYLRDVCVRACACVCLMSLYINISIFSSYLFNITKVMEKCRATKFSVYLRFMEI